MGLTFSCKMPAWSIFISNGASGFLCSKGANNSSVERNFFLSTIFIGGRRRFVLIHLSALLSSFGFAATIIIHRINIPFVPTRKEYGPSSPPLQSSCSPAQQIAYSTYHSHGPRFDVILRHTTLLFDSLNFPTSHHKGEPLYSYIDPCAL